MSNGLDDFKQEWQAVRIVHFALVVGVSLFTGVTLILHFGEYKFVMPPAMMELFILCIAFLLLAPAIGNFFFNKMKKQQQSEQRSEREFLGIYRSGKIVQWALLEGAALFAIVSFLITANAIFLIFMAFQLALLIMARPTKQELRK